MVSPKSDEGRIITPGGDFSIARLGLIDPIKLQGIPVPERRWLWPDWIPFGTTSALYGDGGTGKSMLALQLMTAVATGQPFLGMEVTKCKVFGIFCEDDPAELHRRQTAMNAAMRVDFADLDQMQWVSRVGDDNLLNTFSADGRSIKSVFATQVEKAIADFGAQFVVVDTAADTYGGNENIRGQVRQYIAQLTKMALQINGAVLLLAHPSVTGRNSGSGDGGSTAWNNSVRSRIYIKRQDAADGDVPDPDVRIVSRMKANYAAIGASADLTLRYNKGAFDPDGTVGDLGTSDRAQQADQSFLAGMVELTTKGIRVNSHRGQANYAPKSLREKTDCCAGFSERELGSAMNRLIKANRVSVTEEGPPSRRRSRLVVISPPLPGV